MREPIGTTRKGQLLFGGCGLVAGLGGSVGLMTMPNTFEPILKPAFFTLSVLLRSELSYDPSQRTCFAILMAVFGIVWAVLFAYAFVREPARNRAIDAYLQRGDRIDQARRATLNSSDDLPG